MDKLQSDVANVQTGLLESVATGGRVRVGVRVGGVLDMGGVLGDCSATLGYSAENIFRMRTWQSSSLREIPPDDTADSEALGTLPVSKSSGDAGTVLGAVADSCEARRGARAGVVGEVDELYDGIVDPPISVQG